MVESKYNNTVDEWYLGLMDHILDKGFKKGDRTGTGVRSIFGATFRHDMSKGFPLLTSKEVFTKGVLIELFWFLGLHMRDIKYRRLGRTNIKYLVDNKCYIWVGDTYKAYVAAIPEGERIVSKAEFISLIQSDSTFAFKYGNLGPVYGTQWCAWGSAEQLQTITQDVLCEKVETLDEVYDAVEEEACEIPVTVATSVREWGGIDQIDQLINDLKVNPDSRRLMVTAWNPSDIPLSVLPPCHYGFQCYTEELFLPERLRMAEPSAVGLIQAYKLDDTKANELLDVIGIPRRRLSLAWNQRSVDVPLGLPFNIASYGFLLHMLASVVNMVPGELIGNLGDCHIYNDQAAIARFQSNQDTFPLPTLKLKPHTSLAGFELQDFVMEGYQNAGKVRFPLSN